MQGALDGKAAAKVKDRIDNILKEVRWAGGWVALLNCMPHVG